MAQACNGNGQLQWPARVREVIENIEPVNAPSCYRISLLCTSLEVTARLKSVDAFRPTYERVGIEQSIFREERSLGGRSIDADPRVRGTALRRRVLMRAAA